MDEKKYVFISYAHKDADKVVPVLRMLEENGVRFWFDAGIEAGADWPKTVAGRLRSSGCVAVFTSGNFARSQNCTRELNFAVSENKPLISVDLDGRNLPDDIAMQLSGVPAVSYTGAEPAAKRISELLSDGFKGEKYRSADEYSKPEGRKVNGWAIVAAVLFVLIVSFCVFATAAVKGWFGGEPVLTYETTDVPDAGSVSVTTFNSDLALEAAIRSLNTRSVYLCGDSLVSDASAITHEEDGFFAAGRRVERGRFADMSWFNGQEITELAVVYTGVTDLTGIRSLEKLTYLDLSGNDVADLSALKELPELRVLKILDMPAGTDLSVLAGSPKLARVIISYEMRDRAEPLVEAGIEVILKK